MLLLPWPIHPSISDYTHCHFNVCIPGPSPNQPPGARGLPFIPQRPALVLRCIAHKVGTHGPTTQALSLSLIASLALPCCPAGTASHTTACHPHALMSLRWHLRLRMRWRLHSKSLPCTGICAAQAPAAHAQCHHKQRHTAKKTAFLASLTKIKSVERSVMALHARGTCDERQKQGGTKGQGASGLGHAAHGQASVQHGQRRAY